MRALLLIAMLSSCGEPEPSSPPRESDRSEQTERGTALAYHVGVTLDGSEALAEAMLPRSARVSIGSAREATLRIPPELGIEERVVIEGGALRFTEGDRATVYREEEPIDLRAVDPSARSPYPIRERMILYLGRVHVLVDPVVADRAQIHRVRTPWLEERVTEVTDVDPSHR